MGRVLCMKQSEITLSWLGGEVDVGSRTTGQSNRSDIFGIVHFPNCRQFWNSVQLVAPQIGRHPHAFCNSNRQYSKFACLERFLGIESISVELILNFLHYRYLYKSSGRGFMNIARALQHTMSKQRQYTTTECSMPLFRDIYDVGNGIWATVISAQ